MSELIKADVDSRSQRGPSSGDDAQLAMVIYVMYGLAIFVGVTALVGIIMNYVKRDDVRGTWLESHFDWQINTFWFSLLAGLGVCAILVLSVFQRSWAMAGVGVLIAVGNLAWWAYRLIKGILRLNDKREID
ncbi:hypothetical protein [Hydrogenophaga sp. 5NK40-0174]|uniref:DUF4870 family protein n=1 Tax=Hydrogenophaga sp. 5NK40-0174 TaxID=3127649 RepID=UPI0031048F8B